MLFAFSMIHIFIANVANSIVQFVLSIFKEYMHIELKIVYSLDCSFGLIIEV
jgi:hypothetical protein